MSPTIFQAGSRGSDFAVSGKNVLVGGNEKDPPRLPAGVEYLELGTMEDESNPPDVWRSLQRGKTH